MKSAFILLSLSLFLTLSSLGQDRSSFYQVYGFRLPVLHSGQYALTLTPRYSYQPTDQNYAYISNSYASISTYEDTYSFFTVSSTALFGISDKTTLALRLEYGPKQSYYSGNSKDGSGQNTVTYNSRTDANGDRDVFSSSFTLAHRLSSNIEISAITTYNVDNFPSSRFSYSPINSLTPNEKSFSTYKNRYLDIIFNITILSN